MIMKLEVFSERQNTVRPELNLPSLAQHYMPGAPGVCKGQR